VRILHVNKFLYRRGGAEGYMDDLASLQVASGDTVAFFAMEHPQNRADEHQRHFPPYLELAPPPESLLGKAKATARIMYSRSARSGIDEVLDAFEPDIVHLHNIYEHLSPSILRPVKKRNVPAVMTLHDYKLACPTYQFLDHGRICEACLGGRFHNAVLRRCKDGSLSASTVCAVETFVHSVTRAYAPISRFICPSRFMEEKMRAAGVFPDRLRHIRHFIETANIAVKETAGGPVVFAGRLSAEKGVDVLVDAMTFLPADARLEVAGDGPERDALRAQADRLAPGRVHFHGRLEMPELHALIRSASVLAMPSRWYENQPMIVLESFACGVPVVASDLGGAPELIEPGVDGELVPPNDPSALAAALVSFLDRPTDALAAGGAGREKVARDFSPQVHVQRLAELYEEARAVLRPG